MSNTILYGFVLFFNNKKGWGLVRSQSGELLFIHHSNIMHDKSAVFKKFRSLKAGQTVSFMAQDSRPKEFREALQLMRTKL